MRDLISDPDAIDPEVQRRQDIEQQVLKAYAERVEKWIDALKAMGTNDSTNIANWMLEGREVGAFADRMRADLLPKQPRITAGNQVIPTYPYAIDTPSGKIYDTRRGLLEEYDPRKHRNGR